MRNVNYSYAPLRTKPNNINSIDRVRLKIVVVSYKSSFLFYQNVSHRSISEVQQLSSKQLKRIKGAFLTGKEPPIEFTTITSFVTESWKDKRLISLCFEHQCKQRILWSTNSSAVCCHGMSKKANFSVFFIYFVLHTT